MVDRLILDGVSGAISKMLLTSGRDLYDMDSYIDEEFGGHCDTTDNIKQQQQQQCADHGGSYTSDDHPTVTTMSTDENMEGDNSRYHHAKQSQSSVTLDPRTDPFTPRPGKTLVWKDVNMTLIAKKKGQEDRPLLTDVWGEVPETETTAIMGASGAGKTSLLNILAGRASTNGRIRIEADVRLNNYSVDPTSIRVRKHIAFVAQDDSLQATSTPREAIRFSAKLRLPKSTTETQLDQLAQRMVNELGLSSCADTFVGGPLLKGISGGERKRASVGVELVVKPSMVFLDEPTSGLDSFSAVQVCQVLKKVSNAGASVLFTIHQPSSEIFQSFDRLILMHKGGVMFQGPVTIIPQHFGRLGYPIPPNYNPADWVINVAQSNAIAELRLKGFYAKDSRGIGPPTEPLPGQDILGESIVGDISSDDHNEESARHGAWTQTYLLVFREFAHIYRFPLPVQARFGVSGFLALLVGTVYWKVGLADPSDQANITSQLGGIMVLMVFSMLGCAQPAILFFPEERPVFLREYSTNHYSVLPYFLSRLLIEVILTFLQILIVNIIMWNMIQYRGSFGLYFSSSYTLGMTSTAIAVTLGVVSRGNAKVAQQLMPVVLLPQFLFSGFFVTPALIPIWLRWVTKICPLSYAVRIITIAEFYQCTDEYFGAMNCARLLESIGAIPGNETIYWIAQVCIFVCFRTLALYLLERGAQRFY